MNNIGRWHSGIMVEFAPEEKLYVPVSGIVKNFCFDDDKENYILLENKITIPLKNKKTEELSCYSFISNFKHHEKIKRYINEETYFYKLKYYKINEFPVCIDTEIGDINSGVNYINFSKADEDKYIGSVFYMNLTCSKIMDKKDSSEFDITIRKIPKIESLKRIKGFTKGDIKSGRYTIKDGTAVTYGNGQLIVYGNGAIGYDELKKEVGYIFVRRDIGLRIGSYGNVYLLDNNKRYYKTISKELKREELVLKNADIEKLNDIIKRTTESYYLISDKDRKRVIINYYRLPSDSEERHLVADLRTIVNRLTRSQEVVIAGNVNNNTIEARIGLDASYALCIKKDSENVLSLVYDVLFMDSRRYAYLKNRLKEWKINGRTKEVSFYGVESRELDRNVTGLKIIVGEKEINDSSYQDKEGLFKCRPYLFNQLNEDYVEYKFAIKNKDLKNVFIPYKITGWANARPNIKNGILVYSDYGLGESPKYYSSIAEMEDKKIYNFPQLFEQNSEGYVIRMNNGYAYVPEEELKVIIKADTKGFKDSYLSQNTMVGFANGEEKSYNDGTYVEWCLFFTKDISEIKAEKKRLRIPKGTPCKKLWRESELFGLPKDTIVRFKNDVVISMDITVRFYPNSPYYNNLDGLEFKDDGTCVINSKFRRIFLYDDCIDLKETVDGDIKTLAINSTNERCNDDEYKKFIEKIILPKLLEKEHKFRYTKYEYYQIGFSVSAKEICERYNISEPLAFAGKDANAVKSKMQKDLLKVNMFYGNEEEMDSEFPIDYERDGYEESDQNIIEIEDNKYSFDKDTIRNCLQSPLEEYFGGLLRLNYGKGRITDALEEDGFKCDLAKLKEDLMSYNPEFRDFLDAQNFLYADSTPNDKKYTYGERYIDAMKYLHRTICLHPLEFSKRTREDPKNHATGVVDIRSDIDIDGFIDSLGGRNKFYFVYPPLFYRIMEESRLLEFNPYAGMKYSEIYSDDSMPIIVGNNITESGGSVVVDNPGFAPVWAERNVRNPNVNGYACVTGFFNEEYTNTSKKKYYHEGVDFRGDKTAIESFIYGKVVMCKNQGNKHYGVSILVKGDKKEDGKNMFYLLGHMTSHVVNKGDSVYPGKIVGYVGNTGNSLGAHLHLTVYKTEKDNSEELWKDGNYIIRNFGVVNPFDHSEKRKGE